MSDHTRKRISNAQLTILSILRIAIGWHFLYEGLVKASASNWTAAGLLTESKWILSPLFHWMVSNPAVLNAVDMLNIIGLIVIGLGLMLGAFTKLACISGLALLSLYYLAIPPLIGLHYGFITEGSYLVIDKTLIEFLALLVIVMFPTGKFLGLDRLLQRLRIAKQEESVETTSSASETAKTDETPAPARLDRREILKGLATVPIFGAFVVTLWRKYLWESYEERHLKAAKGNGLDAVTSATVKSFQFSSLKDLKGNVPHGQIGGLKISRLFLGGNLIGGWAHARDLIYVSKLVKKYHSDQKVFDTFQLAEQCGINTILTNPQLSRVINAYWRKVGGKIQFISDCGAQGDVFKGIELSVDGGAHSCYVQGEIGDRLVREGKLDDIAKAVEIIRGHGIPAGVGAHQLETIQACVKAGIKPDYWVKTLHHVDYWSADKETQHDNIWCVNPDETIAFMEQLEQPWIGFKTLAAGAIHPKQGFPYAFRNGADFICVGMYDFQIVDDVNIALDALADETLAERSRPWRA